MLSQQSPVTEAQVNQALSVKFPTSSSESEMGSISPTDSLFHNHSSDSDWSPHK